jgi:hypothetical protein
MFFPKEYDMIDPLSYYNTKDTILKENKVLLDELNFYKSILEMRNSCIFNLSIKKMNGKRVWFDKVRTDLLDLEMYDTDEEIDDMIHNPPKPER